MNQATTTAGRWAGALCYLNRIVHGSVGQVDEEGGNIPTFTTQAIFVVQMLSNDFLGPCSQQCGRVVSLGLPVRDLVEMEVVAAVCFGEGQLVVVNATHVAPVETVESEEQ